jgi:hypothetical protein
VLASDSPPISPTTPPGVFEDEYSAITMGHSNSAYDKGVSRGYEYDVASKVKQLSPTIQAAQVDARVQPTDKAFRELMAVNQPRVLASPRVADNEPRVEVKRADNQVREGVYGLKLVPCKFCKAQIPSVANFCNICTKDLRDARVQLICENLNCKTPILQGSVSCFACGMLIAARIGANAARPPVMLPQITNQQIVAARDVAVGAGLGLPMAAGDAPMGFLNYGFAGIPLTSNTQVSLLSPQLKPIGDLVVERKYVNLQLLLSSTSHSLDETKVLMFDGNCLTTGPSAANKFVSSTEWAQAWLKLIEVARIVAPSVVDDWIAYFGFILSNAQELKNWSHTYQFDVSHRKSRAEKGRNDFAQIDHIYLTKMLQAIIHSSIQNSGKRSSPNRQDSGFHSNFPSHSGFKKNNGKSNMACRKFQFGSCPFGKACRFAHECAMCGDTSHDIRVCKKEGAEALKASISSLVYGEKKDRI